MLLVCTDLVAQDPLLIDVQSDGTVGPLTNAIHEINNSASGRGLIRLDAPSGIFINLPFSETQGLPFISSDIQIQPLNPEDFFVITPGENNTHQIRLTTVLDGGSLTLVGGRFSEFGSDESGGVLSVQPGGNLTLVNTSFDNNITQGQGSSVFVDADGEIQVLDSTFSNGFADRGGSLALQDTSISLVRNSIFINNNANEISTDILASYLDPPPEKPLIVNNAFVSEPDSGVNSSLPFVSTNISSIFRWNSFGRKPDILVPVDPINLFEQTDDQSLFDLNILDANDSLGQAQLQSGHQAGGSKPMVACETSGSGSIQSLGSNVVSDDSCDFDGPGDLPSTDPMITLDQNGFPIPDNDSPAIDISEAGTSALPGDTLQSLNCGYVDVLGNGRPQDGDGDGEFECDAGAVEIVGEGAIVNGHSGAFFNALRDGEGTYVEILNESLALVYTFTYRPDGSGAAWFLGVGNIRGNSIVITQVLRPIGTSFGSGFNAADINFVPTGSMSMVFPTCSATMQPGVASYTGDFEQGYEALYTLSQRLGHVLGCGSESVSANVGLSGSYFDPARNGEGIIVQWLTSGQVLVVFFTFDLNNDQLWLIGIGTPDGDTVTMDALYPASFTSWGSNYDAAQKSIETWGTFSLDWKGACNTVEFSYNSTVSGFGSATHNYSALSKLAGTSCP